MITVQNIIDWASPHGLGRGMKHLRIGNEHFLFSIVGGGEGLYGDFINTFEVAVINLDTNDYMTSFFFDTDSEVVGHISGEEIVGVINRINNKNDFQVR
jgi:hypothetical protein